MQNDENTTPVPSRRGRMLRGGAVAAGVAGGMTVIGIAALGPVTASASPATGSTPVKVAAAGTQTAVADPNQAALDAYFGAGYAYDDAVSLAKIWNESDLSAVKVEAGTKLLAGEKLPIPPGTATTTATGADDVTAFFNAGYTYDDAVTLSGLWHTATPYDAKVAAGKKIAAGETLPIKP